MTTIYKRKLYRDKPIKLNWFDLSFNWLSAKADIAGDLMNRNPFLFGFIFTFIAVISFFSALEV